MLILNSPSILWGRPIRFDDTFKPGPLRPLSGHLSVSSCCQPLAQQHEVCDLVTNLETNLWERVEVRAILLCSDHAGELVNKVGRSFLGLHVEQSKLIKVKGVLAETIGFWVWMLPPLLESRHRPTRDNYKFRCPKHKFRHQKN